MENSGRKGFVLVNIKQIRHNITKRIGVRETLARVQHSGLSQKDVFVASYPRSGSTWLRFMLYELITGAESNFTDVDKTIAGIGRHRHTPRILPNGGRLLQTHWAYRSAYRRAIYLVRDVRDVIVSEYNFTRRLGFFEGTFDIFFEQFMSGQVNRYGLWGAQVQSWHQVFEKDNADVLWIRFEDMKEHPQEILKRTLDFLKLERENKFIARVVQNHTIESMKKKENASSKFLNNAHGIRFVTNGAVGKWQDVLSTQQLRLLENEFGHLLNVLGYPLQD